MFLEGAACAQDVSVRGALGRSPECLDCSPLALLHGWGASPRNLLLGLPSPVIADTADWKDFRALGESYPDRVTIRADVLTLLDLPGETHMPACRACSTVSPGSVFSHDYIYRWGDRGDLSDPVSDLVTLGMIYPPSTALRFHRISPSDRPHSESHAP